MAGKLNGFVDGADQETRSASWIKPGSPDLRSERLSATPFEVTDSIFAMDFWSL